jgi:uncharacterized membrane protein
MKPLSAVARAAALISNFALIIGLILWTGSIGMVGVIVGAVLSMPLLWVQLGLLRRNLYIAKWASLMLVMYTGLLLAEAYTMRSRHWTGLLLSAMAAIEFVSLSLYIRLSQREALAGAQR